MDNPNRVTYFAATDSRGRRAPFGLKAADRRRHMYVIGKTGMGKSTLLENMAIQDIQNGEGLAFIDPHGGTADTLLNYIPEHRIKDVVYFAPFDLDKPVAFNVMEDVGYDKRHLVVSGLMATFKKIWIDAWSARMEYILSNTLLALLEYPDATLLGVNRMYTDKAYRKLVVENVKDPIVKDFWTKEFANYGDRYTQEATPAIQNKIGQFTSNPLIRNIIAQPHSSFDIRDLMDKKKILIINLSKGQVGETNMRLLGSMLTTRIFLGAMSRAELSTTEIDKLPDFYFYVDEFQNFANDTFAEILSEARKYKLNLLIAHQYVEQMEEQVRAAVFGNVGTTVAFRVGPFDAEVLETIFSPEFMKEDLVNLGFAQIYLTLMIDGVGSRPFSAVTMPQIERPARSFRTEVIQASRDQFGNLRSGIEVAINTELSSTDGQNGPVEPPAKKQYGPPKRTDYPVRTNTVPARQAPSPQRETQSSVSFTPRPTTQPTRQERPEVRSEQKPAERSSAERPPAHEPRRVEDTVERSAPPAGKTADDLKAILRTMTSSASKEREQKKIVHDNALKGALADVIKKGEGGSSRPTLVDSREIGEGNREKGLGDSRRQEEKPKEENRQQERSRGDERKGGTADTRSNAPFEVAEDTLRAIFKEPLS